MDAYWVEFLGLMAVFGLAAIMPGIDFTMVLRQSIANGRKAGIFTSLGIASAVFVHATYTILGVGLIISQSILAFNIIRFLGAAYLLYLGIQSLRAPAPEPAKLDVGAVNATQSIFKSFGIGFLTNLLNPKATIFFVSVFTTLVSLSTPIAVQFGYVSVMALVLFSWFALVAIFFTTPKVRAGFYAMGKWFNRATGAVLIGMAAKVALTQR
ncbi:LysE family translocator [Maritalea mediterranea]|uniref:LysE family transporter n=1 Tax=Maritalea mediterranea TaxID=2909667 RepID=A0ABS9ECW2_9HYPH|nr:LysE family transporter [Maritalea mediterranea]MCF4100014.1 LysE family transporter [Maritalea mediterranea]